MNNAVTPAFSLMQTTISARCAFAFAFIFTFIFPNPAWAQPDCAPSNRGMAHMEVARIALLNDQHQKIEFAAFIADDSMERADGYQYICPAIIARTTILFRYSAPSAGRFHMHNVKAPLDIGFFDAEGVLIQSMLMRPYQDGKEILYGPMQKFQYALEARQGFFTEKKLSAGISKLLIDVLP